MVQVVVLQSIIWYTLLLFLFEYRAARSLVSERASEERSRDRGDGEGEVVHVIVAGPSLELERVQANNRVVPDSGEVELDGNSEGKYFSSV